MQRNNGDMIILSSTYISFESSASTTYFKYVHLPAHQLPVSVYWVRANTSTRVNKDIAKNSEFRIPYAIWYKLWEACFFSIKGHDNCVIVSKGK